VDGGVDAVLRHFGEERLDALVAIGGEDTLGVATRLHAEHAFPVVGVPKTIDNDLSGTDYTFGFDTAVSIATEAIDRLHSTAESHNRVIVVEVMGRHTGWIAVMSGIAGGADVILIPEIPFDLKKVAHRILEREQRGARFSIVVVAEGASAAGEARSIVEAGSESRLERLGGIAEQVALGLEPLTGKESRHVLLGHLQRGGSPTSYDRVLATRFGSLAVELIQRREFGVMVALRSPDIVAVPLELVVGRTRNVPAMGDVVRTARNLGISFGD
jgi:6-phosphofructokinase 1